MHHHLSSILPLLYAYMSLRYIVTWLLISLTLNLSPDPSEYVEQINQYGHVQYWNSVTGECSNVPVKTITSMHFGIFMSLFLMSSAIASLAPKSFVKAILNPLWHPPILKELDNFFENTCFEWTPDIGQRHLWMIWLFSYKANYDLKARMVIDGSKCILGVDFNPDEVYCGTITATSIKIFFAPSALYGLILRWGDLVTPESKEFMLCIATPSGIVAPKGMILQVLGKLYDLPSSWRNFSKAVDLIVAKCGYKSRRYDPKFFCKWIDGMPILVMFHSDDFRWSGPPHLLAEWNASAAAFEPPFRYPSNGIIILFYFTEESLCLKEYPKVPDSRYWRRNAAIASIQRERRLQG